MSLGDTLLQLLFPFIVSTLYGANYFLNDFEMVPVAPITTGITVVFTFHIRWFSIVRSLYLKFIIIIIIIIIIDDKCGRVSQSYYYCTTNSQQNSFVCDHTWERNELSWTFVREKFTFLRLWQQDHSRKKSLLFTRETN